ncbi:hypothetical protein [Geodermatophilus chilensis]|nr:hypothetical protein [Geodermatophilus chilensis]
MTTIRSPSPAEDVAEDVGGIARDVVCNVAVDVAGDGDRRVAEAFRDDLE